MIDTITNKERFRSWSFHSFAFIIDFPIRNNRPKTSSFVIYDTYLSSTALKSLRWQYTAFVVIPSPHGLPPNGRHEENGVYAHLYVKQVTFSTQSCVSMEWGHFLPSGDLLRNNDLVRCCCSLLYSPVINKWASKISNLLFGTQWEKSSNIQISFFRCELILCFFTS